MTIGIKYLLICGEGELKDGTRGEGTANGLPACVQGENVNQDGLRQVCDSLLPTACEVALAPGHPAD